MKRALLAAAAALGLACSAGTPAPDAGGDAATADAASVDAASVDAARTDDAATTDAPDWSAASVCPRYDAHARECFGDDIGEDFLAECFSLYTTCGDVVPAVVRCRLETVCAELGRCMGMAC